MPSNTDKGKGETPATFCRVPANQTSQINTGKDAVCDRADRL